MPTETVLIERAVNFGTDKKPEWKTLRYMQTSSLVDGNLVEKSKDAACAPSA